MTLTGIYCIFNSINHKRYIGQAKDIELRWKQHRHELRHGSHYNKHLQKSWDKYGENAFQFSVLEVCEEDKLSELESMYIEKYGSYENGYNMTQGGEGTRGFYHTDEYKQYMSERMKNRIVSDETRKRLSESHKGKPIRQTEAIKEGHKKVAEKLRGRERTPEHCKHISESKKGSTPWNKGMKMPEGYKHPWLGRHHNEETKRKLAEARIGTKQSREQVLKKSKSVICIESGVMYDSITEAAKAHGVSIYAVSNVLRGKSQTAAKCHWKYA